MSESKVIHSLTQPHLRTASLARTALHLRASPRCVLELANFKRNNKQLVTSDGVKSAAPQHYRESVVSNIKALRGTPIIYLDWHMLSAFFTNGWVHYFICQICFLYERLFHVILHFTANMWLKPYKIVIYNGNIIHLTWLVSVSLELYIYCNYEQLKK